MEKIIKTSQIPGGCCDGVWYDRVKKQNMEDIREDILKCGKKYTYIGPVKSNTKVYGWRVTDGERFFAATFSYIHGVSVVISVFQTNKKGEYDVSKLLGEWNNYCDIETVLDKFFEVYVPDDEEFEYEEKALELLDDVEEEDEAAKLELK